MENMQHLAYGLIFILGTLVLYNMCMDVVCLKYMDKDKPTLKFKLLLYVILVVLTFCQGRFILKFTGFEKSPIYDHSHFGIIMLMILGWFSTLVSLVTTASVYHILYSCLDEHTKYSLSKPAKAFLWYASYVLFIVCLWAVFHIGVYVELVAGKLVSTVN